MGWVGGGGGRRYHNDEGFVYSALNAILIYLRGPSNIPGKPFRLTTDK